jgi:hypothetical protein
MPTYDEVYAELVNRWIRLKGTEDPNTLSQYNNVPIGEIHEQTGVDPVLVWIKNRAGATGWDQITSIFVPRTFYANSTHVGYSDGSLTYPFADLQDAIDAAEALTPTTSNPVTIFVTGIFVLTTELIIKAKALNILASGYAMIDGSQDLGGGVYLDYAVAITNATKESWALYKAGGYSDYSLLVNDGSGPQMIVIKGIIILGTFGCLGVKGDSGGGATTEFLGGDLDDLYSGGLIISDLLSVFSLYFYARNTGSINISNFSYISQMDLLNAGVVILSNVYTIAGNITWTVVYDENDPSGYNEVSGCQLIAQNSSIFANISVHDPNLAQINSEAMVFSKASYLGSDITLTGHGCAGALIGYLSGYIDASDTAVVSLTSVTVNQLKINSSTVSLYLTDVKQRIAPIDPYRKITITQDPYTKYGQSQNRILGSANLRQGATTTKYDLSAFDFEIDGYVYTKPITAAIVASASSATGASEYKAVTFSLSAALTVTQTVSAAAASAPVYPPAPPSANAPFAVVQIPPSFVPGTTVIQNSWITQGYRIKG